MINKSEKVNLIKAHKNFFSLYNSEHDILGRVLKCHLIIEHYIDKVNLKDQKYSNFKSLNNLSFYQKIHLIPFVTKNDELIFTGLKEINNIRNKLSHKLQFDIETIETPSINTITEKLLHIDKGKSKIELIESFTVFISSYLEHRDKT